MKMTKELRDEIVTELYERCASGEISVEEREYIIQEATNDFISGVDIDTPELQVEKCEDETPSEKSDDAKSEDKTSEENPSKELSQKEKYELFKDAVYKKCKDGEITEEFREELLEKAREKFLPDSE